MQNSQSLPHGFIPVEEAIALIKADRRDNATVDLQFLVNNLPHLRKGGHYNIRRLRTRTPEEIERLKKEAAITHRPIKTTERLPAVHVYLETEYDVQILLKAIRDAYKERTSITLREDVGGVNKVSTLIDEENHVTDAMPRVGVTTNGAKEDDIIPAKGYTQVVEGA